MEKEKTEKEGRAAAVKLHFILTDLLYTLISLLKKRKWHSIRRNPFLLEQACQLRDEWIQAELFLLRRAPPGTQRQGYRSQHSSLSIAIINTPSEYNEPYHDTWISVAAVDSSHLTACWKPNVK